MDSTSVALRSLACALASFLVWLQPLSAVANPAGGQVHSGVATIQGQGTGVVNVNQQSTNAVLSWQSFNIKPGETTNFRQPGADAIAINRILDNNASAIFGSLNANGNVYLINPNGILFGPGSQVNVGGLAAGTSYKAGQQMIQNGFDPSVRSAPGASIVNQGTIQTREGGFVYLVAPKVENGQNGVIVAPGGQVSIAAGSTVYLTDRPDGRGVQIAYTAPRTSGETPLKDVLGQQSFAALRSGALRQAGVIEANAVRERGGKIELYAENELEISAASRTAAAGDATGRSGGGTIRALSDDAAVVAPGATLDVSGGRERGAGGFVEISAKNDLTLSGTFKADGTGGERGGEVLIDPEKLNVTSTTFSGASNVNLWASRTLSVETNAQVRLQNAQGTPTLALRSGRDVTFGAGSKINDESDAGASDSHHWNVEIVAGAKNPNVQGDFDVATYDPAQPFSAASADSHGSLYLSGAQRDAAGHVLRDANGEATLQGNDGEVSLRYGTLVAKAAKDVVIGNGGGLRGQRGDVAVSAGRNVRFTAGSTTQDGVIESGSGSVYVVAGDSVILSGSGQGNAAIRTRGLEGFDELGRETRANGGSIWIQALRGDVDSGMGNRWLQPGGLVAGSAFDPMPAFRGGILGIGTEAGGSVSIFAGRNVFTGSFLGQRSGGTASGLVPEDGSSFVYDGSHIGLFGGPVVYDVDDEGFERAMPLGAAPNDTLTVVAGRNITGDYMARNGKAVLRAGYEAVASAPAGETDVETLQASTAPGGAPVTIAPSAEALRYPDADANDREAGWLGTLGRPLTVDLIRASLNGRGRNGVAIRGIEDPSLVYQPATVESGTFRVPTYGTTDAAVLEAATGDVILLGNDITLPFPTQDPRFGAGNETRNEDNPMVRLLPPTLQVTTHSFKRGGEERGGDLVLLNDFTLFPSATGGLELSIAGLVRTAEGTAASAAKLKLDVRTVNSAKERGFTIPLGTVLVDPSIPGIEFVLTGTGAVVERRLDAQVALGGVTFQPTANALKGEIVVPQGTRIAGLNGEVYETTTFFKFDAPAHRRASGAVTFFGKSGTAIPVGTRLVGGDGTIFRTTTDASIARSQSSIVLRVEADTLGRDAKPLSLRLLDDVPGVNAVTNFKAVVRPTTFEVPVRASIAGAAGNLPVRRALALLGAVAGIQGVINVVPIGGGADTATFGALNPSAKPSAEATINGPMGALAQGHRLQLKDPSILPAGISAIDVIITANAIEASGGLRPGVYKSPVVVRSGGNVVSTRPDPAGGQIISVLPNEVWQRDTRESAATLQQSDAAWDFDGRTSGARFDYDRYYRQCHSGAPCPGVLDAGVQPGAGPTHAGDLESSSLFADEGFLKVKLNLAKAATLRTNGSVVDVALRVQHASPADVSQILIPYGQAIFGGRSQQLVDLQLGRAIPILSPGDPATGFQVAGPGTARVLVGVVPFAEADRNGDGRVTPDEFGFGPGAIFDAYDDLDSVVPGDPRFRNGYLTAAVVPYVPTLGAPPSAGAKHVIATPERRGSLALASASKDPSAPAALGIESIGNAANPVLRTGGAALVVATSGDVSLNERGTIGSLQGGSIAVDSIGGGIFGGDPGEKATDKRGIYSLNTPAGLTSKPRPPAASGGGAISVRSYRDFDIGRSALTTLSGSSITLQSVDGSITAGKGAPFENAFVNINPVTGLPEVRYKGAGIAASGGAIKIVAKRNVNIGAGIRGQVIAISAGQNINAGTGAISASGNVSLNAGGSIGGNVSAGGSVSIGGGTVSSTASVSAAGLVTGGGAAATNASTSVRTSTEVNKAADGAAQRADAGGGLGRSGGTGPRGPRKGVIIDVQLQKCEDESRCAV